MDDKKGNMILFIVLVILMIVAIVIVIVNPNKFEQTVEVETTESAKELIIPDKNNDKENEKEEKNFSMQEGGTFCKVGNKIVFYEDTTKGIYLYDLENNKSNKIATIEYALNKIYFDGENIYILPDYFSRRKVYKMDLQGNETELYNGSSLQLWIAENEIYFVNQIGYDKYNKNPQGNICVMDKDGNNVVEIAKNIKNYFYMNNDKIYYTTQDRKMYVINKDGSNPINILEGRSFVNYLSDKYLLYVDYANQEAEHILNLETNEDKIVGYFGIVNEYQGKTYINIRKRLDDGAIEDKYTLFEIKDNGSIVEIRNILEVNSELKYISNDSAYIYNEQQGIYIINLSNNQKENAEEYAGYDYFIGGNVYKIDKANIEEIKIERIEL